MLLILPQEGIICDNNHLKKLADIVPKKRIRAIIRSKQTHGYFNPDFGRYFGKHRNLYVGKGHMLKYSSMNCSYRDKCGLKCNKDLYIEPYYYFSKYKEETDSIMYKYEDEKMEPDIGFCGVCWEKPEFRG